MVGCDFWPQSLLVCRTRWPVALVLALNSCLNLLHEARPRPLHLRRVSVMVPRRTVDAIASPAAQRTGRRRRRGHARRAATALKNVVFASFQSWFVIRHRSIKCVNCDLTSFFSVCLLYVQHCSDIQINLVVNQCHINTWLCTIIR